ncbi:phosphatase PAP2 family protein [Wenyingzhuangia sp. chi5]|uniref:Phosphatase PAP2 family protein n=1 Tax=Wenyingzhuangia gilva TaxID=3057677 RepID=A0ABT8VR20_9FLAO|nr:phosphatase PAP2 family protein [Wenyingzhuangia sp. chi5]MDO3694405.1 phosphatase PAP2 family protein [Wenyingzhuangia sp. chi5]
MKINHKVLLPFIGVLLLSLCFFSFPKGEIVLAVNKTHTPFLNRFFAGVSSIGNTMSIFLFIAIVLRYKLKFLYFFVMAFLIESTIVILCKHLFFDGLPRPYLLFEAKGILTQINFVEGVRVNKRDSFPSGHTAYAFVIATFFALKIKKMLPAIGLCLFAMLVGISRMYLVQHFFMDVFAGAVVGISSAYIAIVLIKNSRKRTWYNMKIRFTPTHKNWFTLITFPDN